MSTDLHTSPSTAALAAQLAALTARVVELEARLAHPPQTSPTRYLGIAELEERLGKDRSTVFRWVQRGLFPAPTYLGRERAWPLWLVEAFERGDEAVLAGWEPGA